jgi:glycosyltransferase involved in cell wall biosynthesis
VKVAILSLHRGGMAHCAAMLARSLLAVEPETAVACFIAEDIPAALFDPRVRLVRFPVPQGWNIGLPVLLLRAPAVVRRLRRAIENWRPDILHVNSGHLWQSPMIGPLSRRMPVVATIHDVFAHPGERRWGLAAKRQPLLRHARRILVHSETLRQDALRAWKVEADRLTVVPLGLLEPAESPAPPAPERDGRILLLGRVYAYKGIGILLAALAEIAKVVPHVELVIAGAGDLSPWRAAIGGLGTRVVLINRYLNEQEVRVLIEESSVVALPYVEASQSGVALMAAALGKPVVASRVGCIPEVVTQGETGILVEPGDAAALAAAIVSLLRTPTERRRLGQEAQRRGRRNFGPAAIGQRLFEVYRDVLAAGPGGPP